MKHTSCTSCSLAPTGTIGGLSTPIFVHGTEFQLPDLLSHKIRKGATLAQYPNYHSTDLLISVEGSFDSVLPQHTQNIDFILTDVNQDDTTRAMVLMSFEHDVALQGTMLQQPLLGSKHTTCKIAVMGSRSVGTSPFNADLPSSLLALLQLLANAN